MAEEVPQFILLFAISEPFNIVIGEDNLSCRSTAMNSTMTERTKQIDLKYQFNMGHVCNKTISLVNILTAEILADLFTKPLPKQKFINLVKQIGMTIQSSTP